MASGLLVSVLGAAAVLLLACNTGQGVRTAASPSGGSQGAGSQPTVTFRLTLDAAAFSNKKQITVAIYDAEQLSREAAGTATPEETFVSRDELARGLVLPSRSVSIGERYRVVVAGMAADDCNRASAAAEGTAAAEIVGLSGLAVVSTKMACPPLR
ncbi:MAG: hypothetical protein VKS61_08530 [Candidatus Sericytochromatia bacterium]|nr:hypothetical protein [Candidatus Sericytochromatia bacterium]